MQINFDFDKPSLLICKFWVFIEQIYFIGVYLWPIKRIAERSPSKQKSASLRPR